MIPSAGGIQRMGRQTGDQGQLFYLFNLERRIPAGHLLRRINPVVTRILVELIEKLTPFYSDIGRPSIDPEAYDPNVDRRLLLRHPLRAGGCARKSRCTWRIGGSVGSILTTRSPRNSAAARVCRSGAKSLKRWYGPAWTLV
jgi:hypothetical protein